MTGRVRSVFSVCAYFSLMIGREARPVTVDRTRPVVQGAYWTLTRRWHYGVRSFLQRVRSLCCCALLRLDQRVRSFTGPARPIVRSASGQRVKRVRSVLRDLAVVRPVRPVVWTSTSGHLDQHVRSFGPARPVSTSRVSRWATGTSSQLDQRVRSTRFRLFKFLMALFEGVRLYILVGRLKALPLGHLTYL
jgi:hypothetical protein